LGAPPSVGFPALAKRRRAQVASPATRGWGGGGFLLVVRSGSRWVGRKLSSKPVLDALFLHEGRENRPETHDAAHAALAVTAWGIWIPQQDAREPNSAVFFGAIAFSVLAIALGFFVLISRGKPR
jgi:hypothetical protein